MFSHLVSLTIATLQNRKGVTAAEYAILGVAIVVVVGTAAAALGSRLTTKFGSILP